MTSDVREIVPLLDLEELDLNLFRGASPQDLRSRVFGGQVVGQALVAAYRTVQGRMAHSLHSYFLRPGDPRIPILYEVDRIRDGKSFTTRRVNAIQRGEAIFTMMVSFHVDEPGLMHQRAAPAVPGPEELRSNADHMAEMATRACGRERALLETASGFARPVDERAIRPIDWLKPEKRAGEHGVWMKARGPLPDDPIIHQCVAAYASDLSLLESCVLPHGRSWLDEDIMMASLDHAMWFHHPCRADEWLLYVRDSPVAAGSRGLNFGHLYDSHGRLSISVAQEGLVRIVRPK